ncbi:MAG: hypothetical protein ABSA02_06705 [Trebonia sp.]
MSNGALYAHFDSKAALLVAALATARRDEQVARPMRDYVGERVGGIAELMRVAQDRGELDTAVSAEALAHFCFLLAMGSALVAPDLHAVDENEWDALLTRLMASLAPPQTQPTRAPRATAQQTPAQEEEPR